MATPVLLIHGSVNKCYIIRMDENNLLHVHHLNVILEGKEILKDITFSVPRGGVLAIVGPNGAGKSVLFRTLLGMLPYSGSISWSGPSINSKTGKPKIGYIPQRISIDKDFPLSLSEFFKLKTNDYAIVIRALSDVGLSAENKSDLQDLLSQKIGTLSGGELQRVLIAWSLLDNPDVLLYDEPTSGIDIGGEETIYNLLSRLKKEKSLTILIISHDLNIVYKYASSVVCLDKQMICHGIPREVLDPKALTALYGGQTTFYQHQHQ